MAVVGLGRHRLHQAGQQVGRDARQHHGDAGAREDALARRLAGRPRGHPRVDVVDQLRGTPGRAGCAAAAGRPGSRRRRGPGLDEKTRMRSHISTASSMLCVTIRIERDRHAALAPQVEQVGAQRLGGQHVERRERLVHQQHLGMDHQRAGEADALAHAARQLLGIGALEAVEADQVDRGQRALAALGRRRRAAPRARSRRSPARSARETARSSGTPWRPRRPGPSTAAAADRAPLPSVGRHQAGDDAQQRRLAGARAAEQADDLVAAQRAGSTSSSTSRSLAAALGVELAHAGRPRRAARHAAVRRRDGWSMAISESVRQSRRKRRSAKAIERPPEQAVEDDHEHRHHGDARARRADSRRPAVASAM